MTMIMCPTPSHVDDMAACLRRRPEKLILLGQADRMAALIGRYEKLLERRGQRTKICGCDIQGKDFRALYEVLDTLIRQEPDCVIHVTGGDGAVLMAIGAVLGGLDPAARQRISVERWDRGAGVLRDCLHGDRVVPSEEVRLTVEELIGLHGGILYPDAYQPPEDCGCRDLDGLWELVTEAPKEWNRSITLLNEFESRADSKTQVFLPLAYLRDRIQNFRQKEIGVRELLDKLHSRGVIRDQSSRNSLEYTYVSPMLQYCTQKAGNVLEVKTLLEGRGVLEDGAPYFHDGLMSVSIDWDGTVHDPAEGIPETRNEIDVILMRGTTPLFISCKNGIIGEEELYKLHTVAERFGGPHAKKMLIATDLDRKSPAAERAFIQRAWDMGICLVTDAAQLSEEGWQQIFRQAMRWMAASGPGMILTEQYMELSQNDRL